MNHRALILLALLIPFGAACSSTQSDPIVTKGSTLEPEAIPGENTGPDLVPEPELLDLNRVLVRVNEQILTVRSLRAAYFNALDTLPSDIPDDQLRAFIDAHVVDLIGQRLIEQAAARMGVKVTDAELEQDIARIEKEVKGRRDTTLDEDLRLRGVPRWEFEAERRKFLLVQKYLAMSLGLQAPTSRELRQVADTWVGPEEVRSYYDRHRDEFAETALARVTELFIRLSRFEGHAADRAEALRMARELAETLAARARAGEDFAALRAELGEEPLEMFRATFEKGKPPPSAFAERFAWSAPVGSISDPIETPAGFLVLKLTERSEDRVVPFAEARRVIEENLRALKAAAAQLRIQTTLLREAVVTPPRYKRLLAEKFRLETEQVLDELSK